LWERDAGTGFETASAWVRGSLKKKRSLAHRHHRREKPSMRLALVLLIMAAALASCGREPQHEPQAKRGDTVIADTGWQYRLRGANGRNDSGSPPVGIMSFNGAKTFEPPSYLPVYPGANIRSGFARNRVGGSGGSIIFETNATPSDVIAYYRRTAAASGFAESGSEENGGTLTFSAEAGRRTIQVIAQPIAQGTHVQIFWSGGH
jgi:hypothetical protein